MRIPKDILTNTAKSPEIYLCQTDKSIIGGLRNFINLSGNFKFNSYHEIEFEIDRIKLVKAILDCLEEDYQEWGNFCCDVNESCYELNANDFLAEVKRVKEKIDNWYYRD